MSASTETFCFASPAAFWLEKNSGASTLSGNSISTPSWTETGAGLGRIIVRRFFHETDTRPRLSPGSISEAGRAACAPIKSAWTSSRLIASGHFSASADSGARTGFPTGICGAMLKLSATGAAGAGEDGIRNGIGASGTGGGVEKTGLTGLTGGAAGAAAGATANAAGTGATGAGRGAVAAFFGTNRSEEHTSELQSPCNLVCRLL